MSKKAVIVSTENELLVHSILGDACTTCAHGCQKTTIEYAVSNPRGFDIKKGSVVELSYSSFIQGLSGILSLLVPFFSAIAGYVLSPFIAHIFNRPLTDAIRASCVLSFLFISSIAVFFITRLVKLPVKPVITAVLH